MWQTSTKEKERTATAEYGVKVSEALLPNLLSGGQGGFGERVERVLDRVPEVQADQTQRRMTLTADVQELDLKGIVAL